MTLKTEVVDSTTDEFSYPCLLRRKSDGIVVLFRAAHKGTVVHTSSDFTGLGYASECWGEDKTRWERVISVTIAQEN